MWGAAATVNLLGTGSDRPARPTGLEAALATDATVHLYGKRRVFDRRKMGHVTAVSTTGGTDGALAIAHRAASAIGWADEAQ
jgi:phosphoribosylaminoimidazole carboxylase (NCAIR synthetase)